MKFRLFIILRNRKQVGFTFSHWPVRPTAKREVFLITIMCLVHFLSSCHKWVFYENVENIRFYYFIFLDMILRSLLQILSSVCSWFCFDTSVLLLYQLKHRPHRYPLKTDPCFCVAAPPCVCHVQAVTCLFCCSGSGEDSLDRLLLHAGAPRRKSTTSLSKTEPPLLRTGTRTIYTAGRPPWYDEHGAQSKEAFVIGKTLAEDVLVPLSCFSCLQAYRCRMCCFYFTHKHFSGITHYQTTLATAWNTQIINLCGSAGLCGGTASGKTTVANKIIEALDVPWVVLLSMDSFYKVSISLCFAMKGRQSCNCSCFCLCVFVCLIKSLMNHSTNIHLHQHLQLIAFLNEPN